MALVLLDADSPAQVRAALNTALDENLLPDDVILAPVFAGVGEAAVLLADPLAATYESGGTANPVKWARVQRAAVLFTAARLALSLQAVLGERFGDYQATYGAWDPEKRQAALLGQARSELAAYLNTATGQIAPLPSFWLAAGRRGR